MLIRYRLIYYAIGIVLMICGRYVHYVSFVLLGLYLLFLYIRLGVKHLTLMVILIGCVYVYLAI